MKSFLSLLLCCVLLLTPTASLAAASDHNRLIALASDALVNAGGDEWQRAASDLAAFKSIWVASTDASEGAKAVDAALNRAEAAVERSASNREEAYQAVSALAKAVDEFVTAEQGGDAAAHAQEKVKELLPVLQTALGAVEQGDFALAKQAYDRYVSGWKKAEGPIRKDNFGAYGKIETKISGVRIALNTEPPNAEKAESGLQELIRSLEAYLAGDVQAADAGAGETMSVAEIRELLLAARTDVEGRDAAAAAEKMDRVLAAWPSVEGQVLTRSPDAYTRIETKMTAVPSLLLSATPDLERVAGLILDLQEELAPYAEAQSYTAWDAGLILFREGLEAILVIAALLAFLNRTGNEDKKKWIWAGAGAGIVGSGAMAFLLSALLSTAAAGSSRELIEGYTGLVAVLFMLTIGAWLHNKSNLRAWNQFIEQKLGAVLAKGALWSLAATAGLAVLREGAETIIFYLGMAPSIEPLQLGIGIGGALALLAVIAFALLKLSARIPIRPFFLVASLLLYYLAFKFIGVSLHALQVSGKLSSHLIEGLSQVPALGIFPSWESVIPQAVVLAVILWNVVRTERKVFAAKKQQAA